MKATKEMKPLTAGRVARRLLAFYKQSGYRWAQGQFFQNAAGHQVYSSGPDALPQITHCCAAGAILLILGLVPIDRKSHKFGRYLEAINVLSCELGGRLSGFNDSCANFDEFKAKLHEIARTP